MKSEPTQIAAGSAGRRCSASCARSEPKQSHDPHVVDRSLDQVVGRMILLTEDHKPDGWPAVQMRDITRLLNGLHFYRSRVEILAKHQSTMRDPERTMVCDIIANGQLLPDLDGKRYGAGAPTPNPANLARESASVDQHSVVGRPNDLTKNGQ